MAVAWMLMVPPERSTSEARGRPPGRRSMLDRASRGVGKLRHRRTTALPHEDGEGRRSRGAADPAGSAARRGLPLALILLELRGTLDARAERRGGRALHVLLAQRLAGGLRRGLVVGDLGHRRDAVAERRALRALHVLLGLTLAVLAVGLGLGRQAPARRRRRVMVRSALVRGLVGRALVVGRAGDRERGRDAQREHGAEAGQLLHGLHFDVPRLKRRFTATGGSTRGGRRGWTVGGSVR